MGIRATFTCFQHLRPRNRGFRHETGNSLDFDYLESRQKRWYTYMHTYIQSYIHPNLWSKAGIEAGNPGWSRTRPKLVCCEVWWLCSNYDIYFFQLQLLYSAVITSNKSSRTVKTATFGNIDRWSSFTRLCTYTAVTIIRRLRQTTKKFLFGFADFVFFSLNISHTNSKTTPCIYSPHITNIFTLKHKLTRQTAKVSP